MNRKMSDTPYTVVEDDLYAELVELADQKVVHVELWEDSVLDELTTEPATDEEDSFDFDLYLEDGVYFELYSATCYVDPEDEPLSGYEAVRNLLLDLVRRGLWLLEVAVDEGDALVLVLGDQQSDEQNDIPDDKPNDPPSDRQATRLYVAIAGWLIEEWDELPEG